MQFKNIPISKLEINRANDRHGELENETAAIAWLFNSREAHMRNLAKDIVKQGEIYEPPLVSPSGDKFIVFDGNRRVTCLKLILDPKRAPNSSLQSFFQDIRNQWQGTPPNRVQCQFEEDRDKVDEILYRRHTGTQSGVGQSTWDDRMKSTFVTRTGKGGAINVADEVEKRLSKAGMLPTRRKIPRSTMNRLLSAEPFRNRLGFSIRNKKFEFTHSEDRVLAALARVAEDLTNRRLVLGDIWDVDGKRSYLDDLEAEGVLPNVIHVVAPKQKSQKTANAKKTTATKKKTSPDKRYTLIPQKDFQIVWPGRLQRHHEIWDELQFRLKLAEHPNAISVLFRVLLELSIKNYIDQTNLPVYENDKLAKKALKVCEDLYKNGEVDEQLLKTVKKFQNLDQLVSADTLNRYVHSPNFAPSPEHLTSLWDSLAFLVVACLKA